VHPVFYIKIQAAYQKNLDIKFSVSGITVIRYRQNQKIGKPNNCWCFNATFSNISAISWRPVLVVEEAGENHRPWASNW